MEGGRVLFVLCIWAMSSLPTLLTGRRQAWLDHGKATGRGERGLWKALSEWVGWLFGGEGGGNSHTNASSHLKPAAHTGGDGDLLPPTKRRHRRPRRPHPQRRRPRHRHEPKMPLDNNPPYSSTASGTRSDSQYLGRKRAVRHAARRRGNRAPSFCRDRKKDLRRFVKYLERTGRQDEARLLMRDSRAAKRHYSSALRYWEEFMVWAESELAALPARRQDPDYQLPGQDATDEAHSRWQGLCLCLHCRLQRKGFFRDHEGLEPTPVMKRMWAEYKQKLAAGNPPGCMPQYRNDPVTDWQD